MSGPLRPFTARNTVLKGSGSAWQNPCPWDLSMCAGWNWRRIQGLHTGLPGRSPGIHRILCAGSQNQFHPQSSLRRMFSLSPILHLNREEALEYTGITGSPENKKPWKKADLPCREGRLEAMSAGGCLPSYSPYPQSCHHHPGRPWRVPYGAFGKACLDSRLSGTAGGCHRGRGQPHGCSDCMPHEGFSHGQSHTHSQPYICRCGGTRRSRAGG